MLGAVVVVQLVERLLQLDTRDPGFEPRHRQNFIYQFIYQLYYRKYEIKEKEARIGPSLKKAFFAISPKFVIETLNNNKRPIIFYIDETS